MKKIYAQLLSVVVISSLLAVSLCPSNVSGGITEDLNEASLEATATATSNSQASVYLLNPLVDGTTNTIKVSSDLISASKTYVPNANNSAILVAGQTMCSVTGAASKITVTPVDGQNYVLVSLDLTNPITGGAGNRALSLNDYISVMTIGLTDNENGNLFFTIWFFTDKFAAGSLDFTGEGTPELVLDPEKTYSNSTILVRGLSSNATSQLSIGSMEYSAYPVQYGRSGQEPILTLESKFGSFYKLTVNEMGACDGTFTDGDDTHTFRISMIEHDIYDAHVIGTAQNPNVMTDIILPGNQSLSYTFKYSNPLLSAIQKDVVSKHLFPDGDTSVYADKGYYLTVSESEDDDSILITVNTGLSKNHLYRICLALGTEEDSYSFMVMFATTGYYTAVIDSSSAVPAVVEINADKLACDYVLLKGLNQDSVLSCDAPGVEITVVKEDNTVYGDFLYLKIVKDNTKTTNEVYDVAVGSGESSYTFSMAVHTFVCLSDVNGFDYEIYSLMRTNTANISWNLGEKDSLLIKVHLPDASSDNVSVNGSYILDPHATIGYQWDQVEFEVREYSLEQRYVIFCVTALENKAMHDGAYMITIRDGGTSAKVIHVAVTNHVDVTVSFVSGAATLKDIWDVVTNERLTVGLDGMSEGKSGMIGAKLYKDGTEIPDYSGMLSISCRCYDDGHASLMMIALEGIQEGLYKVSLPLANDDVYELTFSIVKGAVTPSPSGTAYLLEHQTEIRGSNVRLTLDIEKTSGEELEDARLLVIAKYQGGIVVNFYSKPSLVNGNGTDVIEVSQQNLVQVVVEMVDGFQAGNPVYYGWASYDA